MSGLPNREKHPPPAALPAPPANLPRPAGLTIWTKKYWSAETSLELVLYRSMKARLEAKYSGWALMVT